MARSPKSSVRYWKSRKAYACWIGSTRLFLARSPDDAPGGPTYLAALDQFRKLVVQDAGKGTDDYQVSALLNQYRAHLETHPQERRARRLRPVFESISVRSFGLTDSCARN